MITIEQVMLKLIELNAKGRASLLKRGVVTNEDATTEEIMEKIGDIPIYKFSPTIKSEISVRTKIYKHKSEITLKSFDNGISATAEISVEKGE